MKACHNNPEKSSTAKINKDTPSGYSLFTHCSFDTTEKSLIIIEAKIVEKLLSRLKRTCNKNNQL